MPPCDFKPEEFKVKPVLNQSVCASIGLPFHLLRRLRPGNVQTANVGDPPAELLPHDHESDLLQETSIHPPGAHAVAVGRGRETIPGLVRRRGDRQRGPQPPVSPPSSAAACASRWPLLLSVRLRCDRKVTAAAERQMRRLWHTTNIYVYPTLHEYCEKLTSHLPDPLKVPRLALPALAEQRGVNVGSGLSSS